MTGVYIEVDDRAVIDRLKRLQAAVGNVEPALKDVGEYLKLAYDERFEAEVSPDGTPWAPLSDQTILARMRRGVKRGKDGKRRLVSKGGSTKGATKSGAVAVLARLKILRDAGTLQDRPSYQIGRDTLLFGPSPATNRYAATQQFGDPDRNIPARPFLGISAADTKMIGDILERYLGAAGGR